jgi:hypothetical protein
MDVNLIVYGSGNASVAWRWRGEEGTMRWIGRFSAVSAGTIAAMLLLFWALTGFADPDLDTNGVVAMLLGIVASSGLAIGLMALIFYSNRTEQDEAAHGRHAEPRR